MKILVVEDQQVRIASFRYQFIGCDVTFTAQPKEAIELLAKNDWDCLLLDHDLEGPWICPSGPGTGYEIAKWLEEHSDRQPKVIITHSCNLVGVQNICRALPKAVYIPNCWQKADLKIVVEKLVCYAE